MTGPGTTIRSASARAGFPWRAPRSGNSFQQSLGAREVRITKIAPLNHGSDGWEAEAEILVPNLEVKMLNLPLSQEVLEIEQYAVELEADLSVRSYGPLGANERLRRNPSLPDFASA